MRAHKIRNDSYVSTRVCGQNNFVNVPFSKWTQGNLVGEKENKDGGKP